MKTKEELNKDYQSFLKERKFLHKTLEEYGKIGGDSKHFINATKSTIEEINDIISRIEYDLSNY